MKWAKIIISMIIFQGSMLLPLCAKSDKILVLVINGVEVPYNKKSRTQPTEVRIEAVEVNF